MEYTKEQKENAVKLTAIVAKKLKADKRSKSRTKKRRIKLFIEIETIRIP